MHRQIGLSFVPLEDLGKVRQKLAADKGIFGEYHLGLVACPFHVKYKFLLVDCPFLNIAHRKFIFHFALLGQEYLFGLEVDL